MILELDKTYRMRNGVATKLVDITNNGMFISQLRWVYHNGDNGHYVYSPDRLSPHDIIKEI